MINKTKVTLQQLNAQTYRRGNKTIPTSIGCNKATITVAVERIHQTRCVQTRIYVWRNQRYRNIGWN